MREKFGLDRNAYVSVSFNDIKKIKEIKSSKEKIQNFIKNSIFCDFFVKKEEGVRTQIYWCSKINNTCIYKNCPKRNVDYNKEIKNKYRIFENKNNSKPFYVAEKRKDFWQQISPNYCYKKGAEKFLENLKINKSL